MALFKFNRSIPLAAAILMTCAVGSLIASSDFAAAQSVRPPANATQNAVPGNSAANPTEPGGRGAVQSNDSAFWGDVRRGVQGQVSIPDKKAGVLVQSGGETWRNFRNGPLSTYGAYALAGIIALLGVFYLVRGRIEIENGWAGRTITRFSDIERTGHWLMAVSFVILGLTGLNVLYGKHVLMPVLGKEAFAGLSIFFKWLHNYVAFAFMVGLLLSFVMWVKHNFPNSYDIKWLLAGGGMFSKHSHPPSKKFNAGQKILFWLVMLGGLSISMSGIAMMFPFQTTMFAKTFGLLNIFGFALPANPTPMQEMQFASSWHAMMGIFLTCVIIAHIYIGSIGMQGAFDAMASGDVDENWAIQHHSVWAEEELSQSVVSRTSNNIRPGPQPAE
jgi:formate dehydrogenase subunit gamma